MKKILLKSFLCLLLLTLTACNDDSKSDNASANAHDFSKCDYDDWEPGLGLLQISDGAYMLDFETEMDAYGYSGSMDDPFPQQAQKALENVEVDEDYMQKMILFRNKNKPVCVSGYINTSLYIQPNLTEKEDHYIVGVCLPESSDCWKMNIIKSSPVANKIKDGKLPEEAKVAVVYATNENIIVGLYEDSNY